MTVAYLGPPGTFSEEAALAGPRGQGARLLPMPTIADAIAAVARGEADRAVVPIENSIEGSVALTLDTLATTPGVTIVAERVLAISHMLVAGDDVPLGSITRVLSHPQPLGQCARWLRDHLPGIPAVAVASTAEAVRAVADGDAGVAAIGTRRAASLYGATVLVEGVEDEEGNETRFVWIGREAPPAATTTKTSLTFWGAGDVTPGWLARCLGEFAARDVNLTKIESRPMKDRLGHYRFFVDLQRGLGSSEARDALEALRGHCEEVRVLGSYPAG